MGFLVVLAILVTALLIDSLKLPGMVDGQLSSPSSVPQVMLFLALTLIAAAAVSMARQNSPPVEGWRGAPGWSFLLNREVVILLVMVLAYALMLPLLRFEASTLIFLTAAMYLLERKDFVKKFAVSAATLAAILAVFRYFMQVMLP